MNPRVACAGIPQKLLNYMASGTPTVSFAGSAKAITHQKDKLVVADGDLRAFADAILQLLSQPALAEKLGLAAQLLVERRYSWEAAAEAVERIAMSQLGDQALADSAGPAE